MNINLKVKNNYFEDETILNISKQNYLTIIYGRNGSGKSTISRGLHLLNSFVTEDTKFESEKEIVSSLVDESGNDIQLPNELSDNIFVFNDDFVSNQLRIKKDNLNSIVILGDNVNIDAEINKLKNEIEDHNKDLSNFNNRLKNYYEKGNSNNIAESEKRIINLLKSPNGYAERYQKIHNTVIKGNATMTTVLKIVEFVNKSNINNLKAKYNELLDIVSKTRDKAEQISPLDININTIDEKHLKELLDYHEDIELKGIINDKINSVLSKFGNNHLFTLKENLNDLDYCPLCFRDFNGNDKVNLAKILDSIFDEKTKKINDYLNDFYYSLKEIYINDFSKYNNIIDNNIISKLSQNIINYNSCIIKYKNYIQEKQNNIKAALDYEDINLSSIIDELLGNIREINSQIETYNNAVVSFKDNFNALEKINNQIAYLEIKTEYDKYKENVENQQNYINNKNTIEEEIKNKNNEIKRLEIAKQNTTIAINNINNNLFLIYGNKHRISLNNNINEPGTYIIKSRDKNIKPLNLSDGERNSIALCYFIETIKANKLKGHEFDNQMIVCIDDPITSMDYECRIGIISLLEKLIKDVYNGNKDSNVIILTHELELLQKLEYKRNDYLLKLSSKKELEPIDKKSFSNYSDLFKSIYEFANGDNNENYSIFNNTRKILEEYSTFLYKDSFKNLFSDEELLSKIEDEPLRNYYRNFDFSRILNGESHTQYQVKTFPDNTEILIDTESNIEYIKKIIIYLFKINPKHVLINIVDSNLDKSKKEQQKILITNNINSWYNELI